MQLVDPNVLSCLDYLMASADYIEFIGLMLEFKVSLTNLIGSHEVLNDWFNDCRRQQNHWNRKSDFD